MTCSSSYSGSTVGTIRAGTVGFGVNPYSSVNESKQRGVRCRLSGWRLRRGSSRGPTSALEYHLRRTQKMDVFTNLTGICISPIVDFSSMISHAADTGKLQGTRMEKLGAETLESIQGRWSVPDLLIPCPALTPFRTCNPAALRGSRSNRLDNLVSADDTTFDQNDFKAIRKSDRLAPS
jgi:hypothetical protein